MGWVDIGHAVAGCVPTQQAQQYYNYTNTIINNASQEATESVEQLEQIGNEIYNWMKSITINSPITPIVGNPISMHIGNPVPPGYYAGSPIYLP